MLPALLEAPRRDALPPDLPALRLSEGLFRPVNLSWPTIILTVVVVALVAALAVFIVVALLIECCDFVPGLPERRLPLTADGRLVGVAGLEPAASWSQATRSTPELHSDFGAQTGSISSRLGTVGF